MNPAQIVPYLPPSKSQAYFFLLSFLDSEALPPSLLSQLKDFINSKYCMNILHSNKELAPTGFEELMSQWAFFNQNPLDSLLQEYSVLKQTDDIKNLNNKTLRNTIVEKVRPWIQKTDPSARGRRAMRNNGKKDLFPKSLFIHSFQKLKSIFGHKSLEEEFEDYDFLTSPVYNLLFDKSGKIIITADDDGVIKLWSAENGGLLATLKSHKSIINSIDVSPCNKYLVSCSNDGSLRVWDFINRKPLAVLRENINEKLLIAVFYAFETHKHSSNGVKQVLLLICASEEGNIYIYNAQDFVENNGIWLPGQRMVKLESHYMQHYDFISPKGICSIDVHPQGFLSVGTQNGDIVIFDSLKRLRLAGGPEHMVSSVLWAEHKKTCHLTVWSKDGLKLISASFDGTAKIWTLPEGLRSDSEERLKNKSVSDFTIFFDDTKSHDAKCWAVNWSYNSRYAMASFSRKSRKKTESGKLQSNIQIYDSWTRKVLQRIDSTTCPIELSQFIYIIEPHPFKDNIAFSADYDGKIILWDIVEGLILNAFVEKGTFFNCPSLELPCLDGRFSPDGYGFAVSTYYGTFSIYGYGNRDAYDTTPIEQFFVTDHKRFEFDEMLRILDSSTGMVEDLSRSPIVCNILRNEYPKQPLNSMEKLVKNGYFGGENLKAIMADDDEESKTSTKELYKEYDNVLFLQKQNENHRSLLEKSLEELETQRLSILDKQKKQIMSQLLSQLTDPRPTKPSALAPVFSNLHESFLQAKKLSKLRDIAQGSDDGESGNEQNESDKKVPLKRLQRGSSPQGNRSPNTSEKPERPLREMDFDDPEDENWEIDSSVSLEFKPKKINTRTRTSTRNYGNNQGDKEQRIQTRGLRKKVQMNDDDGDYDVNQSLPDESESEDSEKNKYRRDRLRNKPVRKSYIQREDDDDEEEYKDSEEEQWKKPKKLLTAGNNGNGASLKRKERPTYNESDEEEEEKFNGNTRNAFTSNNNNNGMLNNYAGRTRNKKIKLPNYSDDSMKDESMKPFKTRTFTPFMTKDDSLPYNSTPCARCGREGASVKCTVFGCDRTFHEECAKRRGLERDDLHFFCFECWLTKRRPMVSIGQEPQIIDFSRAWLDFDEQLERHYVPQIGDKVYYFFQGHEDFLKEYWEVLDHDLAPKESMIPFLYNENMRNPTLCDVVGIEYGFPKVRNKKALKKSWILNVMTSVTLREKDGLEFKVQFSHGENVKAFLVVKDVFEYSKEMIKGLEGGQMIGFFKGLHEQSAQILEISQCEREFMNSFWKMVKISGMEDDGYNLRNQGKKTIKTDVSTNKTQERINVWDILSYASSRAQKKVDFAIFKQNLPAQRTQDIIAFIEDFIKNNDEITKYITDKVDFQDYPAYPYIIPFEMNLRRVLHRLETGYYRNEESLKHDLFLIKTNAFTFNDPKKALVCDHCSIVIESITDWIDGKPKSIPTPVLTNNNNTNVQIPQAKSKRQHHLEKKKRESDDEENEFLPQREKNNNYHGFTATGSSENKETRGGRVTRSKAVAKV